MNIHMKSDLQADTLAVFVHGLGGSGYGTWKQFPAILFELFGDKVDIGVFDYASFTRRLFNPKSAPMAQTEAELGDQLADLPYKRFILLGHSMGGLLAIRSLRYLAHRLDPIITSRARFAILYYASPRMGSTALPWSWTGVTTDARYLRAHGHYAREAFDFVTHYLDVSLQGHSPDMLYHVPTFSVRALSDRVVDELSSSGGIPADQKRALRGTHKSLVKPDSKDSRVVQWTSDCIQKLLDLPPPKEGSKDSYREKRDSEVVVEFNCSAKKDDWRLTFLRARESVAFNTDTKFTESVKRGSENTDLVVRVVDADDRENLHETIETVTADRLRQDKNPEMHLGISSFGSNANERQDVIHRAIGDGPPGCTRWLTADMTLAELSKSFSLWLTTAADRQVGNAYYSTRGDIRSERMIAESGIYGDQFNPGFDGQVGGYL
ncbi:alpha/beta hydrolase [Pseudonocardia alni]|nr:alpha/beta hydrolase [Pseudonocardia antarctica]